MGFDFEGDGIRLIELDDAGVVFEDADAPVNAIDLRKTMRRGGDGAFQEIVDDDRAVRLHGVTGATGGASGKSEVGSGKWRESGKSEVGSGKFRGRAGSSGGSAFRLPTSAFLLTSDFSVADAAFERFVDAVFAPGLGEGFQFDVGRVAASLLEVLLHRFHFFQRQEQMRLAAHFFQGVVVQIAQRDVREFELIRRTLAEGGGMEGFGGDVLDDGIGEEALGDELGMIDVNAQKVVAEAGLDGEGRDEGTEGRRDGGIRGGGVFFTSCLRAFVPLSLQHFADRVGGGLGDGVHDPRKVVNFNDGTPGSRRIRGGAIALPRLGPGSRGADHVALVDRIGEQFAGDAMEGGFIQRGFDEIDPRRSHVPQPFAQTHFIRFVQNGAPDRIVSGVERVNLNAMHGNGNFGRGHMPMIVRDGGKNF